MLEGIGVRAGMPVPAVAGLGEPIASNDPQSSFRNGLLTRDPRIKERKKPGLKRARKAPQYTKR